MNFRPEKLVCPSCGHAEATTVCRFCGISKMTPTREELERYLTAIVEDDEETLTALERDYPVLSLKFGELKRHAWREYNEAMAYRDDHTRDENWGEITVEDVRRVRGTI